jgi:hypothetical protein
MHGGLGRAKLPSASEPLGPPERLSLDRTGFPGIDLDGAADKDVPDYYIGVEVAGTGQTDTARTLELFEHLAQRMNGNARPLGDSTFENRNIPAGYTYLAQFAAHDLTINSEDRIDLLSKAKVDNLQARPLILDSLYANGPMISSFCYRHAPPQSAESAWLRLETVSGENGASPRRDIGRLCEGAAGSRAGRPLVADARSDNNAVLSQLVALFSMVHNAAVRVSAANFPDETPFAHYKRARLATTVAYRTILRKDLLKRLLDPEVYHYYDRSRSRRRFLAKGTVKNPVTREFAHATYRMGHAMVRPFYKFNEYNNDTHPIDRVLMRTSASEPAATPLDRTWIAEWSRFFDVPNVSTPDKLQHSMKIGPGYGTRLNAHFKQPDETAGSGLAMLDLLRSAASGVRKLSSLRRAFALAPDTFPKKTWLTDEKKHRAILEAWATRETPPAGYGGLFPSKIRPELIAEFIDNPPLGLFVMIEASQPPWNGERLGPLGSVILAETFFRALDDNASLAFLHSHNGGGIAQATQIVFGGPEPNDMAGLISWVDQNSPSSDKTLQNGDILPII